MLLKSLTVVLGLFWITVGVGSLKAQPVAMAGPDRVLMDTDGDGGESVSLVGSGSYHRQQKPLFFNWLLNGQVVSHVANPTLSFSVGTHRMVLQVWDDQGQRDQSTIRVIVGERLRPTESRIPVHGGMQAIFANGINLAWRDYQEDAMNLDQVFFLDVLDRLQTLGANALRWWVHPNGNGNPTFDDSGFVTGFHPNTIGNVEWLLDQAYARGISLSLCLWSFDMLQSQGQNREYLKLLITDSLHTQRYIDKALVPMLEAIGRHPAVLTWELINEPEGMSEEFGWAGMRLPMAQIQSFINRLAGAIHRTIPEAQVSCGAWSMATMTDVSGHYNYYRDDRLISAGGDPLGTMDFYQVHYYPDHMPVSWSPFMYPASYWGLRKPILIGEYPVMGIQNDAHPTLTCTETYQKAMAFGYAGVLPWSYTNFQGGNIINAMEGISFLRSNYPDDCAIFSGDWKNHPPVWLSEPTPINLVYGDLKPNISPTSLLQWVSDPDDVEIEFEAVRSSHPSLVNIQVSPQGKLMIGERPAKEGSAEILVKTTDPWGAASWKKLRVNSYAPKGNLALYKPAWDITNGKLAYAVTDGNLGNSWLSQADSLTTIINLQGQYMLGEMHMHWEVHPNQPWKVYLSTDSITWVEHGLIDPASTTINLHGHAGQYIKIAASESGLGIAEVKVYPDYGQEVVTQLPDIDQNPKLFPNPTYDLVTFYWPQAMRVELVSAQGKVLQRYLGDQGTFSLVNWPTGLYYLRFTSNERVVVRPLVKN